ncbi:MAG: caspase family protein [Crocinitomicaceae bacterium]|nr:caspase family protein [Crocinitomicaceae bacterium]
MKKLLLIVLLFSVSGFTQKVELTVQTGHSSSINDLVFSPFDDFIASAGSDNKIVIWDVISGKQYKVLLGHKAAITSIAFHPDNDWLVSASLDSTIKVWDYHKGSIVNEIKLPYAVPSIAMTSSGDKFYAGGEELRGYCMPDCHVEKISIQPRHSFDLVKLSSDDKYMLLGGKEEYLGFLIDMDTRQLAKRFTYPIVSGAFDPDNKTVYFGTNAGMAFSYNTSNGDKKSLTTDWMLNTINDIEVDQNYFYTTDDYGFIRAMEKEKWFQANVFKGKLNKLNALCLSHDGRYIASGGNNKKIVVWDLKTQKVANVMRGTVNQINDVQFSKDGKFILIVYEDGSMRYTDLISNQTIVNKLKLDSDVLTKVGNYSIQRIVSLHEDRAVMHALYKQLNLDYEGVYDKLEEYEVTWMFQNNELQIQKKQELSDANKKYLKDLKIGITHSTEYFQDTTLRYDESDSFGISVYADANFLQINTRDLQSDFMIPTGHSDIITAVEINEEYGFIATASWDGMIRFWDIKEQKLMTVFGAFGDGQFVYVNPDGYYFSSKNALDYIGFSMDNQMFSFEQFDLKYNRPDIVIKALPYFDEFYEEAFKKAYFKRLDKLGISEEEVEISKEIPVVDLVNDLSTSLHEDQLTLKLKCYDKKKDLSKLHLFVNGVPEYGRFGKTITGKEYHEEITLTLNPGTNYLQCYVTNTSNTSSLKKSFKVEAPRNNDKGDLYLISIGVSKYEQSNYNLNYAGKDARDMTDFFTEHLKYGKIKSQMLLDHAATKDNILSMKGFLSEAKENDLVILFVAGHGVLDDNLDYFFAPHNMDFVNPSKNGVSFEVFDEILDQTKSRKKIMFLDACHSGEIDKDEVTKTYVADENEKGDLIFRHVGTAIKNIDEINSFELSRALFADMRINNGSTVVSSSGGAEYAIEGAQWKNGVFTYCLLKGLKEKMADHNKDRRVTISELQIYVQNEVNRLTGGKQTPTSRVENLNYDFVIL